MQKLTAMDANFLYTETDRNMSQIASVQIMELPSGISSDAFIGSLKQYMHARLHLVSYLSQKLSFVPGNLDHPAWVKDQKFNMDNHIIEYPVKAPGGHAEFEQSIALLHERKMPLDRPLWALYVLTGLADGKVAYYNSVHHAAIDGASGQAMIMTLMDETPTHPPVPEDIGEDQLDDDSTLSLMEETFANFTRHQIDASSKLLGAIDTTGRLLQRALDPTKNFGAFGKLAPVTPFGVTISSKRTWAADQLPIVELKKMSKTIGCTLNDVFIAICAGGLRSYLDRNNKLPTESLIAGCPVSLRAAGDTRPGTQVTMMNVELATQLKDPLARLLAIKASSATAKEVTRDLSRLYNGNASIPGLPIAISMGMKSFESFGVADFVRGPVNVVISNVPGPTKMLYSNGAKMTTHYPVSIPAHGIGVNITVQGYMDQLYLGITACGKALPDAALLKQDIMSAYSELRKLLLPDNISTFVPRSNEAKVQNQYALEEQSLQIQQGQVA